MLKKSKKKQKSVFCAAPTRRKQNDAAQREPLLKGLLHSQPAQAAALEPLAVLWASVNSSSQSGPIGVPNKLARR